MLSLEEFEYQQMLGSTNDAFVFGLGYVQWQPAFMLSPGISVSDNPFNYFSNQNSLYLLPKQEYTINDNKNEYTKALEEEIKSMITDGKSFWDVLGSGKVEKLLSRAEVSVKIDSNDQLTITLRSSNSMKSTSMSLDSFLQQLAYINPPSQIDQSEIINVNQEIKHFPSTGNTDYGYYAKKLRKFSGHLNTLQQPFMMAENRMKLYSKIPSTGGTTRVFPFEKRLPKWAGKYGNKLIFPRLGTLGIDLSNSTIIKTSQYLKYGGKALGVFGVGLGVADIYYNGINFSNGLHTTMAIVALIPGGQAVAGVYFIVDLAVTITTGKDIGAHIDSCLSNETFYNATPIFIDSPIKYPDELYENSIIPRPTGGNRA